MKPIRLEIAGLQSYREMQAVNFEGLCQGGVFGIFGPTGSGKSSILDAMTLALYGKVERAPKGTQGIMNGGENKLSVSFTFQLSGAGETERYRVERQYKRAGETGVHGTICRLVHIKREGDLVLADKQNEVDAGIVRLIGLEMADFTRAVVLPQGKFAEFLSLAGKERRQMLQRLFRLERYGDALAARLSARSDKVKLGLKEAEAEQQGLGDASPEALQAAAERLANTRAAAAGLRLLLMEAEARHAELARRREREEELARIEAQMAQVVQRAEEMAAKEQRLNRLVKAAELAPALHDADEAEQTAIACRTAKTEAEQALTSHTTEAQRAAEQWRILGQEAVRREPELLVKLERLEQALQLERESGELAKRQSALAAELARLEAESARLSALLGEEQDLLARGKSKQAALKEQLAALLPAADRNVRLQAAVSKREQGEAAIAQEQEAAKEAQEIRERVKSADGRLLQAQEAFGASQREGRMLQAWWTGMSSELDRFRGDAKICLAEAGVAEQRRRDREREQEREQLAHLLAENLKEGQPCPVCGSVSHPRPGLLTSEGFDVGAIQDEGQALADAIQRIGQLEHEAGSWAERSGWHANRLQERLQQANTDAAWPDAAAQKEAAPSFSESAPNGTAPAPQLWNARWDQLLTRLGELTDRQNRWEKSVGETERERTQALDQAESLSELARQAESRRDKLAEQTAASAQAWQKEFADLSPQDVRSAAAEAAAAEREVRDLRERVDKSVGFLEEQERNHRETERAGHEVSVRLAETKAHKDSADAAFLTASGRLREWTGGEPTFPLLEKTKAELHQLRTASAEAKTRAENTERRRQEGQRLLDTAAEREQGASAARERAVRRLETGLAAALFVSAEEVRLLLPDLAARVGLKEELEAFRRTETQLEAQRKLLLEHVSGERLTPEAWADSVSRTETLRSETEDALSVCAKAERDADDLSARRERWEELESRREALATEASRIAQLQSVFRGNAFVEYIAEEELEHVCLAASERLGFLTRRRYALEVDAGGGFVIRDDANGGLRRPVSTLSGGETFLTSLALALALSAQIQLQGKYPLQFFFLDEGFGTLDPEVLETVVTSLEKLQNSRLAVGVISHVPELQARLPRRLFVAPAEHGGRGSRITYETM